MARKTKNCNFNFIEIGLRGNQWISGCGKEITYFSPLGQGVAEPPLPTDNGMKFCPWCAKPIRLSTRKPKNVFVPREAPPEPKEERTLAAYLTSKPSPFSKISAAHLGIDDNHNTYDGWREKGFQVMAGQKMAGRDSDGIPLFHRSSVKEQSKYTGGSNPPKIRRDPWPPPNYHGYLHEFDDDDMPY